MAKIWKLGINSKLGIKLGNKAYATTAQTRKDTNSPTLRLLIGSSCFQLSSTGHFARLRVDPYDFTLFDKERHSH